MNDRSALEGMDDKREELGVNKNQIRDELAVVGETLGLPVGEDGYLPKDAHREGGRMLRLRKEDRIERAIRKTMVGED